MRGGHSVSANHVAVHTVRRDAAICLELRDKPTYANIVDRLKLMLWTAPTLRHLSAIGWLRRNAPH